MRTGCFEPKKKLGNAHRAVQQSVERVVSENNISLSYDFDRFTRVSLQHGRNLFDAETTFLRPENIIDVGEVTLERILRRRRKSESVNVA